MTLLISVQNRTPEDDAYREKLLKIVKEREISINSFVKSLIDAEYEKEFGHKTKDYKEQLKEKKRGGEK